LKKVVVVYSALYLRNYFRAGAVTTRYTFVLLHASFAET